MTNSADPVQKPTDLDLQCLPRQGMSCLAREGLGQVTYGVHKMSSRSVVCTFWTFGTVEKVYLDVSKKAHNYVTLRHQTRVAGRKTTLQKWNSVEKKKKKRTNKQEETATIIPLWNGQ